MNVYDFDNTIYRGDSTNDFIRWSVRKKPQLMAKLPRAGVSFLLYRTKLGTKTNFKEKLFSVVQNIPDIDKWLDEFWDEHIKNIKKWYLDQKRDDDVIISASPEFLLIPACKRLGISNLMASRVDKSTGFYLGVNCFGAEKVRRFYEYFNDDIDEFYSDSDTDAPLAKLANEAYLVADDILIPWRTE